MISKKKIYIFFGGPVIFVGVVINVNEENLKQLHARLRQFYSISILDMD